MPKSAMTTMTVRLGPVLGAYVAEKVGEDGAYENVSEYVRDLIRRDRDDSERQAFARLSAELRLAFAAEEADYLPLTAAEVVARNAR
ncbi:addiction module antitoxin [Frigidibacter oleivorans]|uniref:addiction module antitoxin n=1 Tax=Frigidibacter oleivorans TaxID=2487129 RepID=UPI000F8D0CD9|nr:addiction module antitoxin [Frigidibacter oleivorans]